MATGNWHSVLRAGDGIARAILRGSQWLMAILARRVGTLGSDLSAVTKERPALTLGLLAALLGAILAAWGARSFPRRRTMRQRLSHSCRQLKGALDLPSLGIKLLANPIVRDYLHRTVLRGVSRRLGR